MVAVPVLKLFSMTVKTLAKPMAKRIKTEAQRHPTFRGVLNRMGQATNSISARISIRMAGHTTTKIKPLEEDKAIADGGDLLAEGFIYSLGTFLMVWEYMSSAKEKEEKEAKAKIKKDQEKREMAQALEDINNRLAKLEALSQSGAQGKGGKGASSGRETQVLGLSLALMPSWARRRDDVAGLKTQQGSLQDTGDIDRSAARNETSGCSAADETRIRSIDSSSGTGSVLRGIEGSAQRAIEHSVAPGGPNSGSASTTAQRVSPRR